jgi:hypothetical protein
MAVGSLLLLNFASLQRRGRLNECFESRIGNCLDLVEYWVPVSWPSPLR